MLAGLIGIHQGKNVMNPTNCEIFGRTNNNFEKKKQLFYHNNRGMESQRTYQRWISGVLLQLKSILTCLRKPPNWIRAYILFTSCNEIFYAA